MYLHASNIIEMFCFTHITLHKVHTYKDVSLIYKKILTFKL